MWISVGLAALYGGVGILMSAIGYKLFDFIETRVDFAEEIKKGNMAAAAVIGAFLIGICIIVSKAVGG
jgi:uncharacterized membrane protein YjfL (UPF0719 family)